MQSTKKAPQRKEDGAVVAADDGATIAPPAGVNTTQLVRQPVHSLGLMIERSDYALLTFECSFFFSLLTPMLFSNSLLCPVLCFSFPPPFNTLHVHSAFFRSHPEFSHLPRQTARNLRLCFAWLAFSGGGRGRPSGERGQQREQGKRKKKKCFLKSTEACLLLGESDAGRV